MQQNGLRQDQVSQIRGYADQKLRKSEDPYDPANRRITLIVQYIVKNEEEDSQKSAAEPAQPKRDKPQDAPPAK